MDEPSNTSDYGQTAPIVQSTTPIDQSAVPINPQPSPAPPVGQAPPAATTPKTTNKLPIKYIAIGIVAILIIAVGVFTLIRPSRTSTTVSSSSSSSVPTTYSTVTSTILPSINVSNAPTYQCLAVQQLEQMLNVSANASQHAVFNTAFARNNTAFRNNIASAPASEYPDVAILPSNITDYISNGCAVSYNASNTSKSQISHVAEEVLKSSDTNGIISYFGHDTQPISTVNGLRYFYIQSNLFTVNATVIEGYKDSYLVLFVMAANASTITASANAIASEISNTI